MSGAGSVPGCPAQTLACSPTHRQQAWYHLYFTKEADRLRDCHPIAPDHLALGSMASSLMGLGGSKPPHTSSRPGPGYPKTTCRPGRHSSSWAFGSAVPLVGLPLLPLPGTHLFISGHRARRCLRKPSQACRDSQARTCPPGAPTVFCTPRMRAHACISIRAMRACSHAHDTLTCRHAPLGRAPSGDSDRVSPMGLRRRGGFWNLGVTCH